MVSPLSLFHKMLLENWTPVEEPFPWPPAEKNQKIFAWALNQSKLIFVSTSGNIAQPRLVTDSMSMMIVNAANRTMSRDGAGTNQVLSAAVSVDSWGLSQRPLNPERQGTPLNEGECRAGMWRNADGSNHTGKQGKPHYLAQLLGPKAVDHHNKSQAAFDRCKNAYLNCFSLAQTLGVTFLQIPLISSGIYAPPENRKKPNSEENKVRMRWIHAVKCALVAAMQEFGNEPGNTDRRMLIVLTDLKTPAITDPKKKSHL
ncbi:macro domain-containing protein [Chlamydia pneumoniae]|uniref:Macro domain-containing protein n=1 Tax=Chlamydia pneumoniae TaxID=83558 RepID=Q9Z974_CHLPN|nr:macro domain-containing protein [Chlamydia pneumoniae]AAD18260.1 CT058 hypothetical protein [Chlamydia pneumoniae CWL029]AAF38479.1 hypothetical protein CP_0667 [Chlamydia pneumoniae AR39]CRI32604.1 Uncharacterized protein BN1224_Wien1_A_01110 [Chlamydia pneumoniae]CRI35465.1 Uncharacterized protein BN1224_CM1_A_01120 [Chlamydia pneumoniae]CRI36591.1 Uncharacterized protein BN1224_CV14_A_01100 [Chlamydia pneumoniae]